MGCQASIVPFEPINFIEVKVLEMVLDMGFSRESIDWIYTIFTKVDYDHSNKVCNVEFFHYLKVEPIPYMIDIFKVFDVDGSNELDFIEFLCSLWNFLTVDERTIGGFIFLLCPRLKVSKGSNKLQDVVATTNMESTIFRIHHKNRDNDAAMNAVRGSAAMLKQKFPSGKIDVQAFMLYVYEHQHLVTPLLQTQMIFRKAIIGEKFWKDLTAFRHDSKKLRRYDYPFIIKSKLQELARVALTYDLHDKNMKEVRTDSQNNAIRKIRHATFFLNNLVSKDKTKPANASDRGRKGVYGVKRMTGINNPNHPDFKNASLSNKKSKPRV